MDSLSTLTASRHDEGHDPALREYLRAPDPAEAERLLGELLGNQLRSTIHNVVRRVLNAYTPADAADAEDICSEAVARVLHTLRTLRERVAPEPIRSLQAYTARIAEHLCYEHLRRLRPARARLRNQVWYVLTHDAALTLVREPSGRWLCGVRAAAAAAAALDAQRRDKPSVPHAVRSVLVRRGRAVELNELVDLVAEMLDVHDAWRASGQAIGVALESLPDTSARSPVIALEHDQYLRQLWAEVQLLPVRQRIALLLNLRDESGGDALDLLPRTGVASLREIAATLAIDPLQLAQLWPDLPLDDRRIAVVLGVSRQQVINLRKAARARLARRLARFELGDEGRRGNTAGVRDSSQRERSPKDHV